jgi:hypothetical protein
VIVVKFRVMMKKRKTRKHLERGDDDVSENEGIGKWA